MNKKVVLVMLIVLVLVVLIPTVIFGYFYIKVLNNSREKEENPNYNNDNSDISFYVKEETLSNKGATFVLKNNSNEEYVYEPPFFIEKNERGKWIMIRLDEPLTWNCVIYFLKPNEEIELNIDWSITEYGILRPGKYRLIKSNFRKSLSIDSRAYYFAAEFEIK